MSMKLTRCEYAEPCTSAEGLGLPEKLETREEEMGERASGDTIDMEERDLGDWNKGAGEARRKEQVLRGDQDSRAFQSLAGLHIDFELV